MTVRIIEGDCRDVLRTLQAESVHAVVTDPPYHLTNNGGGPAKGTDNPYSRARAGAATAGFMGKTWDGGDVAFRHDTWREVLRVLKPGGYLLAFGGSRTYHRLASAIEDAGFEIRDQIMWLYGSGFPKSRNLNGEWEGWGTALKPAHEPIVVARKPLASTVAANVLAHRCGALNIDGCRIHADDAQGGAYTVKRLKPGATLNATGGNWRPEEPDAPTYEGEMKPGRWPANVVHDGSDEVLGAFPDAPGQIADASGGNSSRKTQNVYGAMRRGNGRDGEASADVANEGAVGFKVRPGARRDDLGSAARFFYCAKASREDRNVGGVENTHPTVKPTELMRYLVRLVTPIGGTVLDPFAGSGSTGRAADVEGFNAILIEKDPDYAEIARRRIAGDAPLLTVIESA